MRYKVARYCRNCYKRLKISDIMGYSYVCLNCDENFYDFETLKNILKG